MVASRQGENDLRGCKGCQKIASPFIENSLFDFVIKVSRKIYKLLDVFTQFISTVLSRYTMANGNKDTPTVKVLCNIPQAICILGS